MDMLTTLIQEEAAVETMEYALVAGLIALAAIGGMFLLGQGLEAVMQMLAGKVESVPHG